jgi:tetratricopeptide (TPR) repeat protein
VRAVAPFLFALVVGTPAAALAPSSPISAEDSSTIAPPAGAASGQPSPVVTEEGEPTPSDLREAIAAGDWDKALDMVRRQAKDAEDPAQRAALRLVEARVLARSGEFYGAVQTYRTVMDGNDLVAKARSELHDLYVQRGLFDAADRLTVEAAMPGGADPATAAMRAYSASVQGRFAEAARLASDGAVAGDGRSRVIRANALLALGSVESAEQIYLRVLRESTGAKLLQAAHFGLAQVARVRGARAVRAIQDERAAQLGSAPWAELDHGLALRELGRRDEARTRLEGVADAHPELAATARLALAGLEDEAGRPDDALEDIVASLEGSAGDFLALTRLAQRLLEDGRDEPGLRAYRAALALFPDFPPARDGLARALAARGRSREAPAPDVEEGRWAMPGWTWDRLLDGELPFFAVAADRDSVPLDDPRRVVLALVSVRAGNGAAALGWTEGAEASQGLLSALRAEALESVDRLRDARDLWEAILDEGAGVPLARERLARLVLRAEPAHARALWRDLFARYPEFPRARLRMAASLAEAKRLEDALAAYREAEGAGWFTAAERRRIRIATEDLEDQIRERDEATLDVEG